MKTRTTSAAQIRSAMRPTEGRWRMGLFDTTNTRKVLYENSVRSTSSCVAWATRCDALRRAVREPPLQMGGAMPCPSEFFCKRIHWRGFLDWRNYRGGRTRGETSGGTGADQCVRQDGSGGICARAGIAGRRDCFDRRHGAIVARGWRRGARRGGADWVAGNAGRAREDLASQGAWRDFISARQGGGSQTGGRAWNCAD